MNGHRLFVFVCVCSNAPARGHTHWWRWDAPTLNIIIHTLLGCSSWLRSQNRRRSRSQGTGRKRRSAESQMQKVVFSLPARAINEFESEEGENPIYFLSFTKNLWSIWNDMAGFSLAVVTCSHPATCCICISWVALAIGAHKDYIISGRDFRRCEANIQWKLSCIFRIEKSLDAKPFRVNLNCNEPIELAHSNLGINLKRCWSCVVPLSFSLQILICNSRRRKKRNGVQKSVAKFIAPPGASRFQSSMADSALALARSWMGKSFYFVNLQSICCVVLNRCHCCLEW